MVIPGLCEMPCAKWNIMDESGDSVVPFNGFTNAHTVWIVSEYTRNSSSRHIRRCFVHIKHLLYTKILVGFAINPEFLEVLQFFLTKKVIKSPISGVRTSSSMWKSDNGNPLNGANKKKTVTAKHPVQNTHFRGKKRVRGAP